MTNDLASPYTRLLQPWQPGAGPRGEVLWRMARALSMLKGGAMAKPKSDHGCSEPRRRQKTRVGADPPVRDWHKLVEPLIEASRDSERLSASDFAVRINTRD